MAEEEAQKTLRGSAISNDIAVSIRGARVPVLPRCKASTPVEARSQGDLLKQELMAMNGDSIYVTAARLCIARPPPDEGVPLVDDGERVDRQPEVGICLDLLPMIDGCSQEASTRTSIIVTELPELTAATTRMQATL